MFFVGGFAADATELTRATARRALTMAPARHPEVAARNRLMLYPLLPLVGPPRLRPIASWRAVRWYPTPASKLNEADGMSTASSQFDRSLLARNASAWIPAVTSGSLAPLVIPALSNPFYGRGTTVTPDAAAEIPAPRRNPASAPADW